MVRDAWQPSAGATRNRHAVSLPGGESVRLVTPLLPTRRGDRLADRVTVRSFGPMRLAARQKSADVPGRLRVLPEFASRRHLPSRLARLREMDGRTAVQIRGAGTEFDSLREYVIGDDVRSIDWRATARRSEVVVRTWRPERDRRVLIVLDTSRTSAARVGDLPRIDASIEAALLLSALASHAGDRVDLIAHDRRVRAQVAGMSGPRLMPSLAETLAPVEPALVEADWAAAITAIRQRLSQRALVVLLTTLDPAAVGSGLLPAIGPLAHDHTVVLASVADPEVAALTRRRASASEVYDAAAAERTEIERAAVLDAAAAARRRGGRRPARRPRPAPGGHLPRAQGRRTALALPHPHTHRVEGTRRDTPPHVAGSLHSARTWAVVARHSCATRPAAPCRRRPPGARRRSRRPGPPGAPAR